MDAGADVNVQTLEGYTPLYLSSQGNFDTLVKLLLSHKARHDVQEEDGWTALQVTGLNIQFSVQIFVEEIFQAKTCQLILWILKDF